MTYGIFSLESGNALAWFDSEDEAMDAARRLIAAEPDSADALGVMEFDDNGHSNRAIRGQEFGTPPRKIPTTP